MWNSGTFCNLERIYFLGMKCLPNALDRKINTKTGKDFSPQTYNMELLQIPRNNSPLLGTLGSIPMNGQIGHF